MAGFQDVQNFTLNELAPKVVDTVLGSNVLLQIVLQKQTRFRGKTKDFPIRYKNVNNWGSFSWFDTFNTNYVEDTVNMSFEPKFYEQPVVLPWVDLSISKLSNNVIDLMVEKMESASQTMADAIWDILYWDGTGNWGKDFLGLAAAVDDGSSVAVYWGLNRATTYTTLQANVDSNSYTSWWTAFSLAALDAMIQDCRSGNDKPDLILTTETNYAIIEKLFPVVTVNSQVQNAPWGLIKGKIAALAANSGYEAIYYKWIPIIADEKCTANYVYVLNTNYWEFASIEMADTKAITLKSTLLEGQYDKNLEKPIGFSMWDWVKPDNQYGLIAHIYLWGNLICRNPKRQWVFEDVQG